MALYFFHMHGSARERDEDGFDLASDEAARREAIRYGGSLLSDEPDILSRNQGLRINVVNEEGQLRFAVVINALDVAPEG